MKIKAFLLLLLTMLFTVPVFAGASIHVKGYIKKDGTYVAPHERSAPDKSKQNNWSTKGNVNPYTGKKGTANSDKK